MQITVNSWSDLKAIAARKNLSIQWYDNGTSFIIWAVDGQIVYTYTIWKYSLEPANSDLTRLNAERQDFRDNFVIKYNCPLFSTPTLFFAATVSGLVTVSPATDVFEIQGSASRIIDIYQIQISGITTTATMLTIQVIKRATVNFGGTFTNPQTIPYVSSIPTTTDYSALPSHPVPTAMPKVPNMLYNVQVISYATLKAYTDNPNLGKAIGVVRVVTLPIATAGVNTEAMEPLLFDFRSSPISLIGPQESLCVNFSGASLIGPSIDIWTEWGEK
jgi:hypothetical protein